MAPRDLAYGLIALTAVAAVGVGYVVNQAEVRARTELRVRALTGGDPEAGRAAIMRRPCGSCHKIPGVTGAKGVVGPPLSGFASRVYIAGRVANTPPNLESWLVNPHAIDPQTAMPPMGIGRKEARNIAAYLYTLK